MFPERIKRLRKEKGMTQIEFAQSLGVSSGTVAMWETGKRKPQFETLNKLCDLFDRNFSYLVGSSDIPTPEIRTEENIDQLGAWVIQEDYEDVLRKYVLLDEFGQRAVESLIRSEFARCQEQATLNSGNGVSVSVKVKPSIDK